jgi:hypothetical protein
MKLSRTTRSAIQRSVLPHIQHSEDAAAARRINRNALQGYADHNGYGSAILIWTVRLRKIRIMLAYAKLDHDN